MVVLAASICTRGGKAVLSRQFCDMSKARIETLLMAFPSLTKQPGTEHTIAEDENVRYIYQPLDELYILIITNRRSNILQDIKTVQLLVQIVTGLLRIVNEHSIVENAFELLNAFDEVIALGYRENVSFSQVRTYLEMESHEEKIQDIIARNKEMEAKEELKRRAKQLDIQRREAQRRNINNPSATSGGFRTSSQSYAPAPVVNESSIYQQQQEQVNKYNAPKRGKGMQLGKKTKSSDIYESVRSEAGIEESAPLISEVSPREFASPAPSQQLSDNDGILVTLVETVSGELGREGTIEDLEIKGDLQLRVANPSLAKIQIAVTADTKNIQFKTHPNIDKGTFNSKKLIRLKDTSRPFPSNNQPVGVLKWRFSGKDENATKYVPLLFTVWLTQSGDGNFDVTIEYELSNSEITLSDVRLTIPLPSNEFSVKSDSFYDLIENNSFIVWTIPEIIPSSETSSGSFELTAQAESQEDFFPMNVHFKPGGETSSLCGIEITQINGVDGSENADQELEFEKQVSFVQDNFTIK